MRGDFSIIKIKKSQGGVCFLFFVLFFFFFLPPFVFFSLTWMVLRLPYILYYFQEFKQLSNSIAFGN
jgi:hypothetical protein